jgi:Protein of unknown function (DUF559)/AbiEi antitoxin C-terminal domain
MTYLKPAERARRAWALARIQHGVLALFQLYELGFTLSAVKHRVATGRLHPVRRGVYAVGRRELTREGEWMAAVLSCGPQAVLSHESAAALWGICRERGPRIHVSMPRNIDRRGEGIVPHQRVSLTEDDRTRRKNIPVTSPILTLIDLATCLPETPLVAAINKTDNLDLVSPPRLRKALDARSGQAGVGALKAILDRATFVLTESELERLFLPIATRAGLPVPETQKHFGKFRVDFYWPDLGLVVETDGLRYHRTAEQQFADHVRDQAHTAAGRTPLRFTHWQVRYDPKEVERILRTTARRLAGWSARSGARPSRAA